MLNKRIKTTVYIIALLLMACNGNVATPPLSPQNGEVTEIDDDEGCPIGGSAKTAVLEGLNRLKNRSILPAASDFNLGITLASMLKSGDDRERWSAGKAVRIKGYVKDVKPGGVETTNCKSKDLMHRDTHIELVLNPMNAGKNESIIVEVTPRLRKLMAKKGEDWSTPMIRSKYLGRWVEIEGWLLFDFEHANLAENTNPGCLKNWRASAWEVHPVTKITVAVTH